MKGIIMIDHANLVVGSYETSKKFYEMVLPSIGFVLIEEFSTNGDSKPDGAMFGPPGEPEMVMVKGKPSTPVQHLAFRVDSRAKVQEFHRAGLAAGARDHGAPGLRPEYGYDYYAAFLLDPDGNNIEVITRAEDDPAGRSNRARAQ
jgi:catechol 2,3-dioxygenase-like lactoylglutathione lyase family enzyme